MLKRKDDIKCNNKLNEIIITHAFDFFLKH